MGMKDVPLSIRLAAGNSVKPVRSQESRFLDPRFSIHRKALTRRAWLIGWCSPWKYSPVISEHNELFLMYVLIDGFSEARGKNLFRKSDLTSKRFGSLRSNVDRQDRSCLLFPSLPSAQDLFSDTLSYQKHDIHELETTSCLVRRQTALLGLINPLPQKQKAIMQNHPLQLATLSSIPRDSVNISWKTLR